VQTTATIPSPFLNNQPAQPSRPSGPPPGLEPQPVLHPNGSIDWTPLYQLAECALLWVHDVARAVGPTDKDKAALVRSRFALNQWLYGRHEALPVADVMTTVKHFVYAVERDRKLARGSLVHYIAMAQLFLGIKEQAQAAVTHPCPNPGAHIDRTPFSPWLRDHVAASALYRT
jgi:hypothetical protein